MVTAITLFAAQAQAATTTAPSNKPLIESGMMSMPKWKQFLKDVIEIVDDFVTIVDKIYEIGHEIGLWSVVQINTTSGTTTASEYGIKINRDQIEFTHDVLYAVDDKGRQIFIREGIYKMDKEGKAELYFYGQQ